MWCPSDVWMGKGEEERGRESFFWGMRKKKRGEATVQAGYAGGMWFGNGSTSES
jgi:hypothetical protein